MGLTILHISDIHFKDFKEHKYLDLDKDIQHEIETDLEELKANYNKIDIILIGGDIAFSGTEEEYVVADKWIENICKITDCEVENVLIVPGNHDVDRSKLSPIVKTTHEILKKLRTRTQIDSLLQDYLTDDISSTTLLSPFHNYRQFAQKYGSLPKENNLLYWEKDFSLDSNILRIRGVNSALVSDDLDDEHTSKMILGSHQSNIKREKGVINFVLCHHPPQWLYDGDDTNTDFKARAKVHLYGHKHVFGADVVNNCLVLSAGAMQPSRREAGWEPCYNILELNVPENFKQLNINLYRRKWNKERKKFVAEYSEAGTIFNEYNLSLSPLESQTISKQKNESESIYESDSNNAYMNETVIDPNAPNPKRKLAYMFLSLPYHLKLTIAVKLELIEDSDRDIDEVQKVQNYFRRASEKGLLFDLWNEVVSASNQSLDNPFNK